MKGINKWITSIKTGYDRLVKSELSRFNIDEERGLDRVEMHYAEKDPTLESLYPELYLGQHKVSDWYIDGKLAFSIYRKVEMKNDGLDIEKTADISFMITPNGKTSPFEVTMTETFYVVRAKENDERTPFEKFILNRFERKE